ncbi:hypothetical protein [Acinetobacter sp. Ag2]|uniref:hypothetical protein n=1 Tax=Acinetobacter sp. Ag2 TaxID=1646532 RepID=UPI000AD965F9|nr:hypothetical protein [Acinetobacter sp. Ag2]
MIKDIKLKFGRALGLEKTIIDALPITVFVGPNNSGKSQILREIYQYCISGMQNSNNKIIDNIQFIGISKDEIENAIRKVQQEPHINEFINPDHILVGRNGERNQVHLPSYKHVLINPSEATNQFCTTYLKYKTLTLDGYNRIDLVNAQGAGNLQDPPHLSFQMLFRDNQKRYEVRRIIY